MNTPFGPLSSFNAVDLAIAVIVLLGAWSGWRRGFLAAASTLVTLAAGLLIAILAHAPVASLLAAHTPVREPWAAPLAFVALVFLTTGVFASLARTTLRRIPYGVGAHGLNRALGVLPGAIQGLLQAAIVSLILLTLPIDSRLTAQAQGSVLAERLAAPASQLEDLLRPIFEPAVQRTMDGVAVAPESQEHVKLPFSVQDARPRPDLEAAMLALVNGERTAQGLSALRADPEALETARAHSRDMLANGYFSHVAPDGRSPFDRMRASGLKFRAAGENLALAGTLPMAHQGLMNSPGHRANILQPAFGRLAIGILDGGRHGLMITQTFRN
jgi:uncharacterized protein YkwD